MSLVHWGARHLRVDLVLLVVDLVSSGTELLSPVAVLEIVIPFWDYSRAGTGVLSLLAIGTSVPSTSNFLGREGGGVR